MKAARLRHTVRVERSVESANTVGEPVQTWELLAYARAGIEALRGRERMAGMEVQADVDHRILLRWQSELDNLGPKDRIVFGSKVYDIKSAFNVDERNRQIEVMARLHL